MINDDTNNPNGMDVTMLMGPRDHSTHVANSSTAASPIFEDAHTGTSITAHTTDTPTNDTIVNSDIAASPTLEDNATSTVGAGSHDDTHIVDSGTAASPTLKRKRKYAPANAARRQCKRWEGRRDLDDAARTPDSGGAQAGGDGEGRA